MKTLLLTPLVFILGCASVTTDPAANRLTRVGNTLETAAYIVAGWHLIDNPEDRDEIVKIGTALGSVVTASNLIEIAAKLSGKGDKSRLMIGGAMLVFEQELGQLPIMDQHAFVNESTQRFRQGIAKALAETK